MATIEEVDAKVSGLVTRVTELEKISNSIAKINTEIEKFVTNQTFNDKTAALTAEISSNNEEIKKLKAAAEKEPDKERARIGNLIDGKLKELKREVFLWDKFKIPAVIITLLLSFATVFVLKMDAANITQATRMDLSAALSILAALFALFYLILSFSNAKNLENLYSDIKELEKLETSFTNPEMTSEQARTEYEKIMKL